MPDRTQTSTVQPGLDPHLATVGQCIANPGTDPQPRIQASACTVAGSYKIIMIATGVALKENAAGQLDVDTARDACPGTGWAYFYGFQDPSGDQSKDVLLCLTRNS